MTDLSAFDATGTDNPNKQVSVTRWNDLLDQLETAFTAASNALGLTGTANHALAFDQDGNALAVPYCTPEMFGAVGDDVTDDSAAFTAALAYLDAMAVTGSSAGDGVPALHLGAKKYYLGSTGLTLANTIRLLGQGSGTVSGYVTALRWDDDVTGITITAPGCILDGLALIGGYALGLAEAEAHAIDLQKRATIRNCFGTLWGGNFVNGDGATYNINGSCVENCAASGTRNGVWVSGADANVIAVRDCDWRSPRQCGVRDQSFLGIRIDAGQCAGAGTAAGCDGVTIPVIWCSYNGNAYGVIQGQSAGASINAPSGDTTDNAYWYYIKAGGVTSGRPAWFSGMLCRSGGPVITTNANARTKTDGHYAEQDQPKSQLAQGALMDGGMAAEWVWEGNNASSNNGVVVRAANGTYDISRPIVVSAGTQNIQYGEAGGAVVFAVSDGSVAHRLKLDGNGDIRWDANNSSSRIIWRVSGTLTAFQFGTAAAVADAFFPDDIRIPNLAKTPANYRRLMVDTAAPGTGAHGQGEWALHRGTGYQIGFKCTAFGTPGTWLSVYGVESSLAGAAQAAAVADLSQTISATPTQAEVQAISDKIDELLASLRTSSQLAA